MADQNSPPTTSPILASGERLAKAAATSTTIAVEGELPRPGAPGEVTTSIATAHEGERMSWRLTAWFKRKFQRGGSSGGLKGEVEF